MRLARVAVRVVTTGSIVVAAMLVRSTCQPAGLTPTDEPRCTGWLPVVPEQSQMIDVVRVSADDAWLLTGRGVFRWDSCAWRLVPSAGTSIMGIERMRLTIDASGTPWLHHDRQPRPWGSSESEPNRMPPLGPAFRFDGTQWKFVDPKTVPLTDRAPPPQIAAPGPERTVRVVSGDEHDRWVIVEVVHNHEVSPGGWGRYEWTELWRQRDGKWEPSLTTPHFDLRREPGPLRDPIIKRGFDRRDPARAFTTQDLWMRSRDDIWIVQDIIEFTGVKHFDGAAWHAEPFANGARLAAVFGTAHDDVWVGGNKLWHFDGVAWSEVANPNMQIHAIGGSGARDIWIVGYDTTTVMPSIRRWDGERWTEMADRLPRKAQYRLTSILSIDPSDTYVFGEWGTMLHWDGARWTEVHPPAMIAFRGGAIENGELWVGDGYSIYRYAGPRPHR